MIEEIDWSQRAKEAVGWAGRMLFGRAEGAEIVVVDEAGGVQRAGRPVVSVVFGDWPSELPGEAVVVDPVHLERLREIVEVVERASRRAPDWWLHGLASRPERVSETGRWVVGLARAAGSGRIIVDLRGVAEQDRRRLQAQLRRWRRLR